MVDFVVAALVTEIAFVYVRKDPAVETSEKGLHMLTNYDGAIPATALVIAPHFVFSIMGNLALVWPLEWIRILLLLTALATKNAINNKE